MVKKISLFIICWIIALPTLAEQLEMIVFLHKNANVMKEEIWPAYPGELALKASKKLDSSNLDISILEHHNLNLTNTYNKLKSSKNFQPVYQIGWQQLVSSSKKHPLQFKFTCPNQICNFNGIIEVQKIGKVYKAKLDIILQHKDLKNTSGVRLTHVAKIKNNELYYFDHPIFGVLLRIGH